MKQEQLSQILVGQNYIVPETNKEFGPKGIPDMQRNRGLQISRDEDSAENLKVGIRDIDEAIMYYFKNVIHPVVSVNGNLEEVPVVYANPERWVEVQREGFYRDKNGKKQLPVIVFKRDSLTKNRKLTNKLDANNPHNFYVTAVDRSPRNGYSRFDLIHNRVPEKNLIVTVVPDFVKLNYSCIVLTPLVSQMNSIVEAINFASDAYWGDPEKFKFQTFVDSIKTDVSTAPGQDRVVKSTFGMTLVGHILPETENANAYINQKRHNKTNVSFKTIEKVIC